MNKNELIKKLKEGSVAVHCETNIEAKEFLKLCKEESIKWDTGDIATYDTRHRYYMENTHYIFNRLKEYGVQINEYNVEIQSPEYCEDRSMEVLEWLDIRDEVNGNEIKSEEITLSLMNDDIADITRTLGKLDIKLKNSDRTYKNFIEVLENLSKVYNRIKEEEEFNKQYEKFELFNLDNSYNLHTYMSLLNFITDIENTLAKLGIEIYNGDGTYRDFENILKDVSKAYNREIKEKQIADKWYKESIDGMENENYTY